MAHAAGWVRRALVALIVLVAVTTTVVATETVREYQEWSDRPLGLLEVFYGLQNADLPPTPSWACDYGYAPGMGDELPIEIFWDGDARQERAAGLHWESELEHRIPFSFDVAGIWALPGIDAAYEHAAEHPDTIVVVLTDHEFRGSGLNERLEGFACANIAVVDAHVDCPESIVAHEVGHVLGLEHAETGLMRAHDVTCDARLAPEDVENLAIAALVPIAG